MYVFAQEPHIVAANSLLTSIKGAILFPLMSLMFAIAFLMFLWGGYEFVSNAESDQGRESGKRHMLWGLVGLLIMLSAYAIISIALRTFGVPVPAR